MTLVGLTIGLLLAVTLSSCEVLTSEQSFSLYTKEFSKTYNTEEERLTRFGNFQKNLKIIEELNKIHPDAEFKANKFADWSEEEIESLYMTGEELKLSLEKSVESVTKVPPPSKEELKEHNLRTTVDLCTSGLCPPVQNTGSCVGGFYATTAAALLTSQSWKLGLTSDLLSAQQFLDCCGNDGCNSGGVQLALLSCSDIMKDSDYSWNAASSSCSYDPDNAVISHSGVNTYSGYYSGTLKDLVEDGVLAVTLDITNAVNAFTFYSGGVFSNSDCGSNDMINPSNVYQLLFVGYGYDSSTEKDYWKLQASYGTDWGESGFIRIDKDKECAMGERLNLFFDTMFRAKGVSSA